VCFEFKFNNLNLFHFQVSVRSAPKVGPSCPTRCCLPTRRARPSGCGCWSWKAARSGRRPELCWRTQSSRVSPTWGSILGWSTRSTAERNESVAVDSCVEWAEQVNNRKKGWQNKWTVERKESFCYKWFRYLDNRKQRLSVLNSFVIWTRRLDNRSVIVIENVNIHSVKFIQKSNSECQLKKPVSC